MRHLFEEIRYSPSRLHPLYPQSTYFSKLLKLCISTQTVLGVWISGTFPNILGQSAALREGDIKETGRQADTGDII